MLCLRAFDSRWHYQFDWKYSLATVYEVLRYQGRGTDCRAHWNQLPNRTVYHLQNEIDRHFTRFGAHSSQL